MDPKPERFFTRPRPSGPDDTVILNAPPDEAVTPADETERTAPPAESRAVPRPRTADPDSTVAFPAAAAPAKPAAAASPPGTTAIPRAAGSTATPRTAGSESAGEKARTDDPAMTAITPVFLDPSSTMIMSTDTEGNTKPAFDPERTVPLPGRADSTMVMPVGATELAGARARNDAADRPEPPSTPPAAPVEPAKRSGRKWLILILIVLLLAAAAAAVVYATAGDVPRGTQVLGVDLGGKSRAEAERLLGAEAAERAEQPVRVRLDGKEVTLQPAAIGAAIDVPATVDAAARSGFRLTGTESVGPVVRLDQARLEAALRKQVKPSRLTIRKPRIAFTGVKPVPTYAAAGVDLDGGLAVESVRRTWPTGGVADVPLTERAPVMTKAQVDELIETVAKPAVAAPVTVTVDDEEFQLPPAAIAKGLVFRSDSAGKLTAAIDGAKLHAAAARRFATAETEPKPAQVVLRGGKPQIVPGVPGRMVDLDKLGADLLGVLTRPAPRTVTGTLETDTSGTNAAEITKLGIKERVSTFTTYFTGGRSSPRSQNIITVAKAVDGAIVKPGETFSLNGHTGERDYASGYKDAPVIVDGVLEPGVAGGASQFTTTLFNAAYYAGLKDVEHKPHSFYFSRYPAVIESTIFYPTLDLKFKNTTPYGVLIDTATTGRSVTVSMWSTKVYDSVKTVYGPRRNVTSPPTVHREDGPKCIASSGLPGFTQDAWRVIRKDGREVAREKFSWRYDPEPRFVCG